MNISSPCVVALTWQLNDTLGNELDLQDDPTEFLLGGHDLLAKIEQALHDRASGDLVQLQLEPEDAFGEFDETLIHLADRSLLPHDLEQDMALAGDTLPEGCCPGADRDIIYRVSALYPEHVILDGNHPLAGIALRLSLKVCAVRPATAAELERGTLGTGPFSL